jgi:hypothetical protein
MVAQHRDVAKYGWGRGMENAIANRNVAVAVGGNKLNGARLFKSEHAVVMEMCGIMGGRRLGAIVKMSTRTSKILVEKIWSMRDGIIRKKIPKVIINQIGGLSVKFAEVLFNRSGQSGTALAMVG